jgi:hypothetical protein
MKPVRPIQFGNRAFAAAVFLAGCCIVSASLTAVAAGEPWKVYTPPEGGCQILLPGKVSEIRRQSGHNTMFRAGSMERGKNGYALGITTLKPQSWERAKSAVVAATPAPSRGSKSPAAKPSVEEVILAVTSGKFKAQIPNAVWGRSRGIRLGSCPGLEFAGSQKAGADGAAAIEVLTRMYQCGPRTYTLYSIQAQKHRSPQDRDRFLNSFRLVGPAPAATH